MDVILTHTTYVSTVADHVHPFMETMFPDGCDLLQQDNVASHRVKMVQERFEEHNNKPPNSPDLNPIEHLCDVLEKHI